MRLATFNVENLYARYNFRRGFNSMDSNQFLTNDLAFTIQDTTAKQVTAQAISEVDADVIALQEVDNLKVLDRFASKYLDSMQYKHKILIDAYDPRHIDVALASRYPIKHIRTYRADRNAKNTAFLFSRDCLEVDIEVGKKMLTVYINHFKSMIGGRSSTYDRRKEQADRVAEIIKKRWGHANYDGNYAVVGDFNDYPAGKSSIQPLLTHPGLVDISQRQQEQDRWTHFWAGGNEYRQIDFLLLSPALAENKHVIPEVMRKGLPYRAKKYDSARFDLVGEKSPKASDHCPVYVDLDLS